MFELTNEDRMYRQMFLSNMDEDTLHWAQKRQREAQRLMTYYKCAMRELETKFYVLDDEYSLQHDRNPINSIKTRLKSVPSIIEKLKRRGVEVSIPAIEQNLNDVAGIRVVCSFVQDVYTIAEALLHQDDITLIERKDYIAHPKKNGYRSLHLIVEVPIFLEKEKKNVRVEVQLRTIAMDCWASLEHQLRYKKELEFTEEMQNELLECAKLSLELDSKMDALRNGNKL